MSRIVRTLKHRWMSRPVARAVGAEAGMTLLEIMIVIALIGIVMGAIGVGLNNTFKKGQRKAAEIAVTRVAQAVEQYKIENHGNCPATLADLVANLNMRARDTRDPWGKEYLLKCPAAGGTDDLDVISMGPDKQEGTPDDIKTAQP